MKKIIKYINRNKESYSSLFISERKLRLIRASFLLISIMLISTLSSSAQKCSFSLTATNNIESVNNEGRIYFMEIQNKGNEEMDINLSFKNNNLGKNPDETNSKENVNLDAKFLNEDGQEMKGILKLGSNELLKFQVKVSVPSGTPIEHWNNLLIRATSDKCVDYSNSYTLYTFIPNPNEK